METKALHFRVDGEWLTDFIRTRYHYENEKDPAIKIISTLEGISIKNAYAVINGDARLGNKGNMITLIPEPDEKFKLALTNHLKWKAKQEAEHKKQELINQNALSQLLDKAEKEGWMTNQELAKVINQDKSERLGKPGHILSATFSDAQMIGKRLSVFEDFAVDIMYKKYSSGESRDAYYDAEMKRAMGEELDTYIGQPYTIKWRTFSAGKNWINRGKFNEDDEIELIDFYNIPVRKKLLDQYINNIVDRLRKVHRKELYGYPGQDFWMIQELEETRRELHGSILIESGFRPMDLAPGACVFRAMVEVYLEKKAKLLGVM